VNRVWLVTCSAMPDGEEWAGTNLLAPAIRSRGYDVAWVAWDDSSVDWGSGLVCLRSPWDYSTRLAEFLAWTRTLPHVLNSARIFEWNTDKSYLVQLSAAGVPVVPTEVVGDPAGLDSARQRFDGVTVLKPAVGVGGQGLVVAEPGTESRWQWDGAVVVQPLLESVRTEGEWSVFVFGGQPVSAALKHPASGEIRVHEEHGGRTEPAELTAELAELALSAVAGAEQALGQTLDYARVDALRLANGSLAVSELEATEPGLYLEVLPHNAEAFADLVHARMNRQ